MKVQGIHPSVAHRMEAIWAEKWPAVAERDMSRWRIGAPQDQIVRDGQQDTTKARSEGKSAWAKSARTRTVTIRGGTYPNMFAASEALGVTVLAIQSAMARGNLDAVGTGNCQPKPVEVLGHWFRSQSDLAIHLGLTRERVRRAIADGTIADLCLALGMAFNDGCGE